MTFSTRKSFDYHTPADQWPTLAEWCAAQSHFCRWDSKNTEIDAWIVVPYTYCPNVAETLDQSNHAAIEAILEEADPSGETYTIRRHGHWATDYEMVLVAPDSAAFHEMARAITRLADYPVLNEEDYGERETEAAYENVRDCVRGLAFERDGEDVDSDTVADELYQWFRNEDPTGCTWGFFECPDQRSVRDHERDEGLAGLGWVLCEDDVYRPESETEPVE